MTESDARRKLVRERAADYLGVSVNSSELAVWLEPGTDQLGSGDAYIVEWLAGPAYWAYANLGRGEFMPGTWTAPWDEKSIAVYFDDA